MRLTMNSAPIRQSLARLALRRQPIHSSRRFSSSDARQDKAQDTLATAQKLSTKVFENVKKFLEPVGEYTGRLFGCVFLFLFYFIPVVFVMLTYFLFRVGIAYKQPLLYNLAVTREILKQIYIRECLQPPSFSTIRSVYSSLWSQIKTPGLLRTLINNGEAGRIGVYGLQAYGIFKVRFHIFIPFPCGIQ